jgi:hypothetical protein
VELEPAALVADTLPAAKDDSAAAAAAKVSSINSSPLVVSSSSQWLEPTRASAASLAATPTIQTTIQEEEVFPMPTSLPPDDLDGTAAVYSEFDASFLKENSDYDPKLAGLQSIHSVVPTKSLQAIEMTSATYERINPNRIGLIDETQEDTDHFLAIEASQTPKAGGPLNTNGGSNDDDQRKSARNNEQADDLRKSARNNEQADDLRKSARNNDKDENSPGINDILSGLLSVVGEGLNFATNYVQENNKRKKEEQEKEKIKLVSELVNNNQDNLFPSRNRTRINNRGPPRISEIPFEAIPLEGIRPGLIPQRPFGTRFPGSPIRPPLAPLQQEPSQTKPAPGEGVGEVEVVTNITLPDQLPTRYCTTTYCSPFLTSCPTRYCTTTYCSPFLTSCLPSTVPPLTAHLY